MNGEIICIPSCPPNHDDKMAPEGKTSPQHCQKTDTKKRENGRVANGTGPSNSSDSEKLPSCRRLEECTSPLQLQCRLQPAANKPAALHCSNRSAAAPRRRQPKKTPAKNTREKNSQNRKVTDYFSIRRSSRKSKTELKCEQKHLIDHLIINGIEEGMQVREMEGKGRAVFAGRQFRKGQYVVEYHGDLLEMADAKKREAEYAQDPETGCYMYYFQYLCKTYCVDATKETNRLGRLINHSKSGNLQTKLHDIDGSPHLILVASRDIDEGEELLYDYGDRSKESIAAHPWLKH
ncbi:N-lysine methyltransferase KMT5A-A [Stigmatopora nigra]